MQARKRPESSGRLGVARYDPGRAGDVEDGSSRGRRRPARFARECWRAACRGRRRRGRGRRRLRASTSAVWPMTRGTSVLAPSAPRTASPRWQAPPPGSFARWRTRPRDAARAGSRRRQRRADHPPPAGSPPTWVQKCSSGSPGSSQGPGPGLCRRARTGTRTARAAAPTASRTTPLAA